jgi:hypothetical protein
MMHCRVHFLELVTTALQRRGDGAALFAKPKFHIASG